MAITQHKRRKVTAALKTASAEWTGNKLGAAMESIGVSQNQLAAAIDVSQSYVSDVVRGRHDTITVENARKFADYFGVSIEDLFPATQEVA